MAAEKLYRLEAVDRNLGEDMLASKARTSEAKKMWGWVKRGG